MFLRPIGILTLASFLTANAAAQTYTIQLKNNPDPGMTVKLSRSSAASGSTRYFDINEKLVYEFKPKGRELQYAITMLKKGQYKIAYEKTVELDGAKRRPFSYQGRTVLFERKNDIWHIGVIGKEPLQNDDHDFLLASGHETPVFSAEADRAIMPGKPVAVGEEWKIDPKKLQCLMGSEKVDYDASRTEARLTKVYRQGTSQFGTIILTMHMVVPGMMGLKTQEPGVEELKYVIDAAIDGSSTQRKEVGSRIIKCRGTQGTGDKEVTVKIDLKNEMLDDCSEQKDDAEARAVPFVELVGPSGRWEEFASKECGYSVSFPGKPEITIKKKEKENTVTVATVRRPQALIEYSVICVDYNGKEPKDPKAALLEMIDNEPVPKRTKEVKLGTITGYELVREAEAANMNFLLSYRIFYADGKLYRIMAVHAVEAKKENIDVKRFFDSFKLTEAKK